MSMNSASIASSDRFSLHCSFGKNFCIDQISISGRTVLGLKTPPILGLFPNPQFYVDDGYSDANFTRTDFQRVMPDMENDKLGIIITKDTRYTDIQKLTSELLRLFIQKIVVHEKDVKYSIHARQTEVIHYTDIGMVGNPAIRDQAENL